MYPKKLIEVSTHGRSTSYLIKTMSRKSKPPEVVTCFGSYKVNTRPLIDRQAPSSDESRRQVRLHFTYSRNNGPIQRVMIDQNSEDWDAIDLLYSKLDSDLCRAQDGESLAFYLLSDGMGVMEQVIPDLNDIHTHPVLLPPVEATRMVMSNVPAQPNYDYTITGIGGDGLIPIQGVFNVDARKIAIPQPIAGLDLNDGDSSYPRWYPNNDIVKEDNIIVIYPSDNTDDFDFDLFKALGGVGNTPITINSCVKAVPRKYFCEASHVVGSQVSPLMLTRVALSRSDASVNSNREPVRFSDAPFPFKAARWNGGHVTWPPSMRDESSTRGHDWIASYRRNDGPLKVIAWNTGSREGAAHHTVWDAIKELLLDDYGRTAFMLSDFNSTASSYNGDSDVTVKSGIGSNLNFTIKPFEEGEPLHRSNQPYQYSGKSVEVRDKQIQFSDESAGAVWNENTITVYPTHYSVVNEYGFDGHSDYYDYLCQYHDQLETGEPITLHSCAAVEPADHIQVNTKISLNSPEEEEEVPRMMGQGLSAAIRLNDEAVKYFKFESHEVNVALNEILTYLYFMGKTPEITISQGDGTVLKINDLYFRSNFTAPSSEISGCSGTERDQEFWMRVGNPMDYEDPNSTPRVSILETPESYKRESNKATFIKHPVNGYTDLFDLIKYTSGDEHTIYSSAVVPSVIWDKIDDGEGPGGGEPVDPEPVEGDVSGIEPFTFTSISKPGTTGITKFDIGMSNTDGYWEIRESGQIIASPNHRADGVGFDSNRDDYKSIVIYNMNEVTRDFEVYVRASTVSVRIENLYTKPGDVELKVTSFGNVSPKMIFRVGNGIVYLPETFPPHITDCEGMFNNAHNIGSDITGWDMSNVTNMAFMFADCRAFNQDISGWNVSNVTQMHSMFWSAYKFNQDLSKWCVTNITSYPNGFASKANAWTQPKPVWGTCPRGEDGGEEPDDSDLPDGIPLRFTVNNLDNQSGDMPFIVNLTTFNPDYTWSIYKDGKLFVDANTIPDDAYVRDDNYFAGKTTYSTSVTLPMQRNTINEYLIYSDVNSVEITSNGNSDEINPRAVTVIEFSDSITEHLFPSNYVLFTVPNELPSYLRSTKSMFFNNKLFNQDISTWDTSNIMDMNSMFAYATSFDQDISHWDVSNVAGMESMFTGATSFNQNLSGWSVSNIPSVPSGFIYSTDSWILPKPIWGTSPLAGVLTEPEIPLTFNVDTDVSIKITVSDVSTGDWKLFKNDVLIARPGISRDGSSVSIDSSKKITVKIYTSGHVGLNEYKLYAEGNAVLIDEQTGELTDEFTITEFSNRCKEVIVGFSKAKVVVTADLPSSITSTLGMFRYCEIFNSDISHWDVSNVTNMDYMFHWARTFNQDLSKWCVSNIPSLPLGFDLEATAWTLPKPVWGTCPAPKPDLPDGIPLRFTVNNLDNQSGDMPFIVNLTTFNPDYTWSIYKDGKLFVDANTIPDDAYVRDDNYFAGKTTYSTSVTLPMQRNTINEYLIYSDVNSVEITSNGNSDEINPRAVTVIEFSDSITEHLFPSNYVLFTVPNELPSYLRSTKSMFFNNKLFNQDISTWDTSNIMDMNSMFAYATSFDQDISHWDVSNVAGMESMFTGATSFNQNLSGWSVSNIPSVPSGFIYSTDSWILPKPIWGTSPLAGVLTEPEIPLTFNVDTDVSIKITVSDVSTGDWKLFKNDVLIARPGISRDGSSVSIDSSKKITVKIYTSGHVGLNEYKLYAEGNAVLIDEQTGELTDEFTITEFSNRCKEVIVGFSKAKVVVTADLPSSITSTLGMFRYCEIFNSDISHWDVSNVTNMDYMFHWARTFNQDLSKWCVSNIPSLPLGFDLEATAWTLPKPVWGTCPAPKPDLPDGTPLEFNIYSPSTNNPVVPLTFTIKAPESGWGLYENNILVCSRWTSGPGIHTINGNNDFITIQVDKNNLMDKTVNYKLFAKTDRVRVSRGYSNLTGATPSVEVISFSDSCASQAFGFEWANLTVPTVLPPCITNAYAMFEECRRLNQDLSMWDTSNILYMNDMFATCSSFNADISSWDVSNVTNMESMFARATNFNQDLSGWNVVNIPTEPSNFAINAIQWVLPKPIWGTDGKSSKVDFTDAFEFNVTSPLNGGFELSMSDVVGSYSIYVDNVLHSTGSETYPGKIFRDIPQGSVNYKIIANCAALKLMTTSGYTLTDLTVTSFGNNINIARFSLGNIKLTVPTTLPSHMTNLSGMFSGSYKFNQDLSGWDVSRVTNMSSMFYQAKTFNGNISNWDMSNVTDMTLMLKSCELFNQDISGWNVSKCTKMTELLYSAEIFNQDISGWQVGSVSNMDRMFYAAKKFNQDLSGWNVGLISVEPSSFAPYTPVWVLPKPIWGTSGTPPDLRWSATSTTVDQDVVDVNATKRINGVVYKSNVKYTPTNTEIKEVISAEENASLIGTVLNKLASGVSRWTLDLDNNRIVYN